MSPEMPCPDCGKIVDFHDEEVEGVEEKSIVCPTCRMHITEAAFIFEMAMGEHDHLLPEEDDD